MKLSEDLRKWRAERPDEYTMDRFIQNAEKLENYTLIKIEKAVEHARTKHPKFDTAIMFAVLMEEVGEIANAYLEYGNGTRQMDAEILDTIAVLVRMLEGDL